MKKVYALLVLVLLMVTSAQAAVFVKFDGIDGESKDKDHDGWIDVLSIDWGMNKPGSGATGATRRRGSTQVDDFSFSKQIDKSTPLLAEALSTGKVIPKVEVHVTNPGPEGSQQTYLKYELTNVLVSSYSISGAGEERPSEEFALNFEKIEMNYAEQDEKGGLRGFISWLFDNVRRRR